jgi:DNA-3-methyladenine glycosylase
VLLFYRRLTKPLKTGYRAKALGKNTTDPWDYEALLRATQKIPLPFYEQPTIKVARHLLSCVLINHSTAGMIVEVEAYLGLDDLAAHASRGLTDRTRVIFGPAGRAYVYFIYGMHECLNVVAEPAGHPGCVLIRALEPLVGLQKMYERRRWSGPPHGLANGPGKLTQALAITRAEYGARLDSSPLRIRAWKKVPSFEIEATSRIGITHCADWPMRFVWKGHSCLSG